MHRFLASALLLLLPSVAQADARADIVALRHGRETSHQEFLGWTSDGRAVARRLVCSEDGESTCRASIDALAVGAPQHTTVLWSQDQAPDDEDIPQAKSPISTAQATRFIRAERRALEGLGRLSPGTAVADPAGAFGLVGGEPTEIYLRESSHPTQEEALRLHVAVRGPRGVSVDLEQLGNEPWRIEGVQVLDAQLDPEGRAVWVALQYQDGVMCWDGEDIEFTVAERARVRAQLANAAGLRAYRAGELDEAGARWLEATAEDPDYAWGWFNRGALESRRGDTDAAAASLGRALALDPDLRARACDDEDYGALAATDAGALLMACGYDEGC